MSSRSKSMVDRTRYLLKLTCVVLATSISTGAMAQISQAQLIEMNANGFACIGKNARELDDGVTDVATIAGVAVRMCRDIRDLWLFSMMKVTIDPADYGRIDINMHRASLKAKDEEAATIYILRNRAAKR